MIARREMIALGAAGLVTLAMPAVLLALGGTETPAPATETRAAPLAPTAAPPLAAAFERPLFAAAPDASIEPDAPGDAPALIGIVGRLDQDAVALVRAADGSSRTLHVGDSVDGWRLESLALDAAFFTRGSQKARVPLPVE
ncbi:hypothetical protein [Sphingomonas sp.]|uniref:hypothetical protein n=1 Tax=Sphingomonas sp. TaxID=28214 RepID=UPI001B1A4D8D|nr:hypothetical protein [Sphingomonas sp.]MBO9714898.1 hypothetical protein [Sphingomonas sp.]